ncbi:MAG: signal peptide peptidase SppA, partial [Moraxellaceae bacterium]
MSERKASLPVRIWQGLWGLVGFIRASLANIIFLFLLIIFISAIANNRSKPIPAAAPLFIAPSGPLVDQITYSEPLSILLGGKNNRDNQTNLRDLIKVIEAAAADSRITALILQLDYLSDSGSAKMAELAEAV